MKSILVKFAYDEKEKKEVIKETIFFYSRQDAEVFNYEKWEEEDFPTDHCFSEDGSFYEVDDYPYELFTEESELYKSLQPEKNLKAVLVGYTCVTDFDGGLIDIPDFAAYFDSIIEAEKFNEKKWRELGENMVPVFDDFGNFTEEPDYPYSLFTEFTWEYDNLKNIVY